MNDDFSINISAHNPKSGNLGTNYYITYRLSGIDPWDKKEPEFMIYHNGQEYAPKIFGAHTASLDKGTLSIPAKEINEGDTLVVTVRHDGRFAKEEITAGPPAPEQDKGGKGGTLVPGF